MNEYQTKIPVMFLRAWNGIRSSEKSKGPSSLGFREQSIADPFDYFSEKIGPRNKFEHSAAGNFVAFFTGDPKITKNVV